MQCLPTVVRKYIIVKKFKTNMCIRKKFNECMCFIYIICTYVNILCITLAYIYIYI